MRIFYPALGRVGRLGNQLWQIASTLGIAARLNANAEFHHWEYASFFSLDPQLFVDSPAGVDVNTLVDHLPPSERLCLQDLSLWSHIEPRIRDAFRPSERARQQLRRYDWFYELDNKCCLHIRRDERVRLDTLWTTHPIPPLSYYWDAIDLLGGKSAHNYVMFSDDIEWCRDAFHGEGFHFVDGFPRRQETYGDVGEPEIRDHLDLLLMADCVEFVIPNSTYSWWGAFLSERNHAIYPAPWYGPDLAHVDASLQFPEHWTELAW